MRTSFSWVFGIGQVADTTSFRHCMFVIQANSMTTWLACFQKVLRAVRPFEQGPDRMESRFEVISAWAHVVFMGFWHWTGCRYDIVSTLYVRYSSQLLRIHGWHAFKKS